MAEETKTLLERFYSENDPMKRKKILEKSIQEGEEPDNNKIRMEIWEARYEKPSRAVKGGRSDGFMKIWMDLQYADSNIGGLFGGRKGTIRGLKKHLEHMNFSKWKEKGEIYQNLLYQECLHSAALYIDSCVSDKNYGTSLLGLMPLSDKRISEKITCDVYAAAFRLPEEMGLVEELKLFSKAAQEIYRKRYPADEFDELEGIREILLRQDV